MKRITMLFPNKKDTLETTEDMVGHYEAMGYSKETDTDKPKAKPSKKRTAEDAAE